MELYGNNTASAQSYVRGGVYSLAPNTYDLWVDGVLVGDDLEKAGLPGGDAVDSFMFYGINSNDNEAEVIIDDIIYANGLISTPTQSADSGSGWRMLSLPVEGVAVQQLTRLSLVQGVPGEFESAACGNTNLFTGYNGDNTDSSDPGDGFCNDRGFTPPRDTDADGTAEDEPVEPGRGFIWYLWEDAFDPDPGNTNGESESAGLPLTLAASGTPVPADALVTFEAAERAEDDDGFFLLGNPFDGPFDLSGLSLTAASGSPVLQTTVQVWDPAGMSGAGSYVAVMAQEDGDLSNAADDLAMWQGFLAEVDGSFSYPLTFTFDDAFKAATTPPFYGRTAARVAGRSGGAPRRIAFTLTGETSSGSTRDEAAVVAFVEDAGEGWDRHDATKLYPFTSNAGLLAPVGVRDGAPYHQAVRSLPYDLVRRSGHRVPLAFFASRAGTFTLTWAVEGVPERWQLRLLDAATGEEVDLRAVSSYAFAAAAMTNWAERFTLSVTPAPPAFADAHLGLPGGYALTGVYPNPAHASARFALEVAEAQDVTVAVYDVLGRRVALLHDGRLEDGTEHAFTVDARALASGLYVVRVEGAAFVEARRLTVMK